MSTIALYARVSSRKQAQEKTIEAQLEVLRAYIQEKGYTIEEDLIFIDEGVSGAALERPGLEALREKLALKQIDQVLVVSPDRLARKLAHQFVLIEEFRKLGVEVVCIDHPEDE